MNQLFNYLWKIIVAAFWGVITMIVLVLPFRMLISDKVTVNAILSIIATCVSTIIIITLSTKNGYDANIPTTRFSKKKHILSMCLSYIVYILVTIALKYKTFGLATNILCLTEALAGIRGSNIDLLNREYGGYLLLSLFIQTFPYIPAMLLGYWIGWRKREKSRTLLFNEKI